MMITILDQYDLNAALSFNLKSPTLIQQMNEYRCIAVSICAH